MHSLCTWNISMVFMVNGNLASVGKRDAVWEKHPFARTTHVLQRRPHRGIIYIYMQDISFRGCSPWITRIHLHGAGPYSTRICTGTCTRHLQMQIKCTIFMNCDCMQHVIHELLPWTRIEIALENWFFDKTIAILLGYSRALFSWPHCTENRGAGSAIYTSAHTRLSN